MRSFGFAVFLFTRSRYWIQSQTVIHYGKQSISVHFSKFSKWLLFSIVHIVSVKTCIRNLVKEFRIIRYLQSLWLIISDFLKMLWIVNSPTDCYGNGNYRQCLILILVFWISAIQFRTLWPDDDMFLFHTKSGELSGLTGNIFA